MEKIKRHANKIIIGVLVVLLAGSAVGNFFFSQKISEMQLDLHAKTDLLAKLNKKLTALEAELDSLKSKTAANENQCKIDNESLKSQIAAFAKQAATCEAIKKKLHIK